VNGIIISRTLISSKGYFDGIIHQIYQSNDNTTTSDETDPKQAIKETFSFMEEIRSRLHRKSIDQLSLEEANYIHLEDAKFYQNGLPIMSTIINFVSSFVGALKGKLPKQNRIKDGIENGM
jgi:hypothetical protein